MLTSAGIDRDGVADAGQHVGDGSVVIVVLIIAHILPTALRYAGDFALAGVLAETDARQAELAHVGPRPAGFGTAVVAAGRAGIARQLGQAFQIAGALSSARLAAYLSIILSRLASRAKIDFLAILVAPFKWHAQLFQKARACSGS